MKRDLLVIFAKAPSGSNVKTRLKTVLTLKERQQLQEAFIQDTLSRTNRLPVKCVLACTPGIEDPFFRRCQKQYGVDLIPQKGFHLGTRMKNAFQWGFAMGCKKVVLIGSDSPTLPVSFLGEAFIRLRHVPVVLGPATDGGYYLIGMRARSSPLPNIFERIKWGSRTVLTETLKRLRRYALLPFWYDVDRPCDLDFLAVHLRCLQQHRDIPMETWKKVKRL